MQHVPRIFVTIATQVRRSLGSLTALLSFCLLLSCSSVECPVEHTVRCVYDIYGTEGADTLKDTLYVVSFSAKGDTLLLNSGVGLSTFSLPVSYSNPEDTLLFLVADTTGGMTLDTVFLSKHDIPHFESVECSASFFHDITSVRTSHQRIDSVTISNRHINYDSSKAHLRIYFKARR